MAIAQRPVVRPRWRAVCGGQTQPMVKCWRLSQSSTSAWKRVCHDRTLHIAVCISQLLCVSSVENSRVKRAKKEVTLIVLKEMH